MIFLILTLACFAQRNRLKHEKWGIVAKAGVSLFDGDIPQENADLMFAAGAAVDYYFIPQVGFIAEYFYTPIGADLPNFKFSGNVQSTTLYVYTLDGALVKHVANMGAGSYSFPLPHGVYIVTLSNGLTEKVVVR